MELSAIQLVIDICRETRVPCHIGESCHWEEHNKIVTSYQKERMKVSVILNRWKWEWSIIAFLMQFTSLLHLLCQLWKPPRQRDSLSLSRLAIIISGFSRLLQYDALLNMIMRWRQRHMIHICNSGCSIKEQMMTLIHESFVINNQNTFLKPYVWWYIFFSLTAEEVPTRATQYKCCPPIRGRWWYVLFWW